MPLGLTNFMREHGLNPPPIYLSIFGMLFLFVGAILENSTLIDIGTILVFIGFCLSIIWIIIKRLRMSAGSDSSHTIR